MKELLFNPFKRYGGWQSLLIALAVALLGIVAAVWCNVHFDGVIDLHTSTKMTTTWAIASTEWAIAWLVFALLLYLAGLMLSPSTIRLLDVVGMQGMARFPLIPAALLMLLPFEDKFVAFAENKLMRGHETVDLDAGDIAGMILVTIISLACIVWTVALMYKAYAVACNLKGARAIVSFVIVIVLAEIASKLLLSYIYF